MFMDQLNHVVRTSFGARGEPATTEDGADDIGTTGAFRVHNGQST